MSTHLCVEAESMPEQGREIFAHGLGGTPFLGRIIIVNMPEKPKVENLSLANPVPATKPLSFNLSVVDKTHKYELKVNNKNLTCDAKGEEITCSLDEVNLAQGSEYKLSLIRSFNDEDEVLIKDKVIKTLTATTVLDSSIKNDSTVYDKPLQASFSLDKEVNRAIAELVRLDGDIEVDVPARASVSGKEVIVSWDNDLERNKSYILRLKSVEAKDGSDIVDPYAVSFKASGGPKVANINIHKTGVANSALVVLTFDQELSVDQDITKLIAFSGGSARIYRGSNPSQVLIQMGGVAKCADITITANKGINSKYGVASTENWSYGARTSCHSVETIGYSVRGRPINAFYYGNGGTYTVFTGAIHGSEASSSYILQDFMAYLENRAREIPADRTVVVVPTLNPDGLASGSRYNANKVNLNRNFATSDWKNDIKDTGGTIENGGGTEAMSEPETKAIANLVSRLRPRHVMSYHAVGSVAIANQAGHSGALANEYASAVGYRNGTGASSEIFTYEITGTFDDWMAQRMGVPSVVVELGSYSYRNFAHHQNAMWNAALR